MDILDLVLINAKEIDCETVSNCARVSKEYNELTNKIWHKVTFKLPHNLSRINDGNCRFCPRYANTPFAVCRRCLKRTSIISATEAKKRWFLNESDLLLLTVFHTHHVVFKKPIRLFYLPEVVKYALKKYTAKELYRRKEKV